MSNNALNMIQKKNIQAYGKDLPWCVTSIDELGPCMTDFMFRQEKYFSKWARKWWENFQFVYGNQQIRWSRRYDFAVDVDFLRRGVAMNQKSQTNISRVVLESLASLLYSSMPDWQAETAEETKLKGKRFRSVCQKLLDAYMQSLCMDEEFSAAAIMAVAYGQFAYKIDWNSCAGQLKQIPLWRKVKAPLYTDYMAQNQTLGGLLETPTQALDSSNQPMFGEKWEPILDANGRPAVKQIYTGGPVISTLTPLEYRREIGSRGMHKTKFVQQVRIMDYDEFVYEYKDVPGQTRHFKNVSPVTVSDRIYQMAMRQYMRMKFTTTPLIELDNAKAFDTVTYDFNANKVLVVEHYDQPRKGMEGFEKGRKLVFANGQCTHYTTPNYHTNKLDGWHPFVEFQWLKIAPNSIATGPLNDVIAKNRELNVSDSLVATSLRRNFGSQLFIKTGSGLDKSQFTGEPAMIHEVADPQNTAMWLHDNQPISPVIKDLRTQLKDDVYESSGAGDALRGDRPKNVSSGYAFNQLKEREEKRVAPARNGFEKAAAKAGEKLLACIKANVIELEPNIMGYLKRNAAGEFTPEDVVAFLSTPADFGVDIKIEPGSMIEQSKATMQANMLELAKGPAAQRLAQDAKVLDTFLKYFDADPLRDDSATHRDRANRENEVFLDMARLGPNLEGMDPPLVLMEDDDDIHIAEHSQCLLQNDSEFLGNENLFQQMLLHMETHRIQKQEKTAEVPPGTKLQVPAMFAQARQAEAPKIGTIYVKNQEQQQAKAMEQQQMAAPPPKAAPSEAANPQAPRGPRPPGASGAGPISTGASSVNTPSATLPSGGLSK